MWIDLNAAIPRYENAGETAESKKVLPPVVGAKVRVLSRPQHSRGPRRLAAAIEGGGDRDTNFARSGAAAPVDHGSRWPARTGLPVSLKMHLLAGN